MHFIILDQCLEAYSCKNIYQKWMQTQSPLLFLVPVLTFAMVPRSIISHAGDPGRYGSTEERLRFEQGAPQLRATRTGEETRVPCPPCKTDWLNWTHTMVVSGTRRYQVV